MFSFPSDQFLFGGIVSLFLVKVLRFSVVKKLFSMGLSNRVYLIHTFFCEPFRYGRNLRFRILLCNSVGLDVSDFDETSLGAGYPA